jgi:Tfp pilus assembly protein PilF
MKGRSRRLMLLAALLLLVGLAAGAHLWADWHFRQAQEASKRSDFAGAKQHLIQCLKVWSQSAAVHLQAARAARKAGAFDETEELLRRCRDLGGDDDAINLEHQLLRVQRGDLAEVEPQLVSRLNQNHPDSVLILEVLTLAYIQSNRLGNAQESLRRWLEREPDRVEAWLLQAYVFGRLQNNTEALDSYRRAVELDPDNDGTRLEMAGHLAQAYHMEEALAQFDYLRQKQGDTPAVLKGMAFCRRLMNQPEEARRLLETVLAAQPRDWRALVERGRLANEYESAAAAEKWFRQAADVAPDESDVNYSLYQCLERLGKHQEAKEVLAKLNSVEADLARLADLNRAIAQTPHDPALRCEAGLILLRNGLETEGLRWLESALAENPRHRATHQALADHYQRTGNSERAQQHRKLALDGAAPPAGGSGKAGP